MNPIEIAQFPHANMRDENGSPIPINIVKGQVFSWYYSTAGKATHVVAGAGAVVPIAVTPDEFRKALYGEEVQQEQNNKVTKLKGAKK